MRTRTLALLAIAAGALLPTAASVAEVKVGDKAPSFTAKDDAGKDWKSDEHFGKKVVVVYFYPADFTGGCTKQACGFRDDYKKLTDKGIEVVGVSGDSVKTHEMFKKDHKLPFTLLADEMGEVAMAFGVPVKVGKATAKVKVDGQPMALERGATIQRWTFIIDKSGKVAYVDKKVNAAEDSKKIADEAEKLSKK